MNLDVQPSLQVWEILSHYFFFKWAILPLSFLFSFWNSNGSAVYSWCCPIDHVDPFYSFSFFFLCSPLTKLFWSSCYRFYLLFGLLYWCPLLHFLFHSMNSSAPIFLLGSFLCFFFFVKFHFVHVLFSWFHWIVSKCFLYLISFPQDNYFEFLSGK